MSIKVFLIMYIYQHHICYLSDIVYLVYVLVTHMQGRAKFALSYKYTLRQR